AKGDELVAPDPHSAPLRDMEQVRFAGVFDLAKLPFFPRASADTLRGYAQLAKPKALAIKAFPGLYFSATGATIEEAERKALDECNKASGSTCMLYAENDSIIL